MDGLEFVGKMNPQPFISLRKIEEQRIAELKEQRKKDQLKNMGRQVKESESELTYERFSNEG